MTAVVLVLVAVVLLVLVVVALGMRSMNKRESSLPPERLKAMAEEGEMTQARSTDEFAAHEPRMVNFSPDFSPIDEHKQPKPVRTGQRGKRGVDEWGNGAADDDDEEFWANIRSEATEGGFGAGGTVKARMAASRPVEPERPAADPSSERTVQLPLPQRPAAAPVAPVAPAAAANPLADLVEPAPRRESRRESRRERKSEPRPEPRPVPSAAELADQRTMTFAAPTPDVMSILGAGATPVPQAQPEPRQVSGSFPAVSASGSFPVVNSGSFPVAPSGPIHGAPTSDPFPAYGAVESEATWQSQQAAPGATSGSWAAAAHHDVLDDAAPVTSSWPAFEQPHREPAPASYPNSYEVRAGWAVSDDDALTGPTPAATTPTAPGRAVTPYDDVLSGGQYSASSYEQPQAPYVPPATPAAWPEPPAANASWPSYGEMYGEPETEAARQGRRGSHHRAPDQDFPDYYR
ncbi:hypothetical protein [Nonomuraea dietziae]|uniref:Uncharacterized protein n=1 Tax=Nonomuraea dietziae TaxID=65515 RepID=A0A7W5V654_9ACTN|nr:hypothetical protein [Nonomuraea dietziae]MBB3726763.1 hypothetical protein [Nonomuraea dietziae]